MSTGKARTTALVTGASSGIGAVYAQHLAARGHDLILVARRRERLESLASRLGAAYGCNVEVLAANLADNHELERVVAVINERPALSFLANCAGLGALGPALAVDAGLMVDMLSVNVIALTRLSLAAARHFIQTGGGTIVNIASILAMMPMPGAGAYSGSKAFVMNFSRALHAELAPRGIRVQVVLPGPVRTEFFGDRPVPFPEPLIMSAETLVDTALRALEHGEMITFPNLPEISSWQELESARESLVQQATYTGLPAQRYGR